VIAAKLALQHFVFAEISELPADSIRLEITP